MLVEYKKENSNLVSDTNYTRLSNLDTSQTLHFYQYGSCRPPSGCSFPIRNILKPKSFVGTLVNDKVNFMFSNLLILRLSCIMFEKEQYLAKRDPLNFVVEGKFCCGGEFCGGKVSDNDFPENYDVYINKRYHFSLICSAPRLCFRQSTR